MATFEEIGKYLDNLISQEAKPKIEKERPKLVWMQCTPRVFINIFSCQSIMLSKLSFG